MYNSREKYETLADGHYMRTIIKGNRLQSITKLC